MAFYEHYERHVEFAFEELRCWDVRRWKILEKTDQLTTGMKWVKNQIDPAIDWLRFHKGITNAAI
ncbi:MAG: RagB/SusD family nutrient uptake outer membrane protein [Ginsengibacter sp.]